MTVVMLWTAVVLLIIVGLAGTVLPALPGTAFVLAGVVLGAWIDDFQRVGGVTVGILAALAVAAWVLDYVAGLLGARRAGASRQALIGAAVHAWTVDQATAAGSSTVASDTDTSEPPSDRS